MDLRFHYNEPSFAKGQEKWWQAGNGRRSYFRRIVKAGTRSAGRDGHGGFRHSVDIRKEPARDGIAPLRCSLIGARGKLIKPSMM
jgi:hypothetical protein